MYTNTYGGQTPRAYLHQHRDPNSWGEALQKEKEECLPVNTKERAEPGQFTCHVELWSFLTWNPIGRLRKQSKSEMEELKASQNQITQTHSMHLLAIKDLTKSCGPFLWEVFKTTLGYKILTLTFHILNPFDIFKILNTWRQRDCVEKIHVPRQEPDYKKLYHKQEANYRLKGEKRKSQAILQQKTELSSVDPCNMKLWSP